MIKKSEVKLLEMIRDLPTNPKEPRELEKARQVLLRYVEHDGMSTRYLDIRDKVSIATRSSIRGITPLRSPNMENTIAGLNREAKAEHRRAIAERDEYNRRVIVGVASSALPVIVGFATGGITDYKALIKPVKDIAKALLESVNK